jgi:toxin HigB-1
MIQSFRSRSLKALYDGKTAKRIAASQVERLRDILAMLDHAVRPGDMDVPGFRLHPLKGTLKGHWAISVSGNWRVTFRFEDGHVVDVDYLDYH